jgi:DNA-binding NtrC family response regulator
MKRILIVDDDVAVTNYFKVFLMQTGLFDSAVVNDSREVEGLLERESFDIVLLDMDMPNVSGMDILRAMRDKGDETPVIVLTGVSDVNLAVKAMKLGAFDYLIKPIDDDKLLEVMDNALEHRVLHKTISDLPTELTKKDLAYASVFEYFPTQDQKMIRLFHQAENLASSDLNIFIWGESGTGKEALARAIHQASPRRDKPFVALEADSQTPEDFPAFFFGQARDWRGTRKETPGLLEEADKGTLFLNNVDALTIPVQVRLRRIIQTGEYYRENSTRIRKVDVRIIVSSTHDLTQPEYAEDFNRDLLYHLVVNSIEIPALRERSVDIPLLADLFMKEEAEKAGKNITGFEGEFLELITNYSFPDNVQELRTIIAGAVANAQHETISAGSLPPYIRKKIEPGKEAAAAFQPRSVEEVVREHVSRTLEHFGGDRDRAVEALGIAAKELDKYMQ